ncbi:30S ribosomal protein S7 [Candidatus Berkelbacteria bacterium]|nr:30S ribosomal protein S7 [Candidatus Berkelbacteria bacterium]
MRGTRSTTRRILKPDQRYGSVVVAKFINTIMHGGQKRTAEQIVYRAFGLAEQELKKPALEVFELAIKNVSPLVEVRSKRIGGATYQVPTEVRTERKVALAMRWIIGAARNARGNTMEHRLAAELKLASESQGAAIGQRDAMHRMAEANKAFAHYARF